MKIKKAEVQGKPGQELVSWRKVHNCPADLAGDLRTDVTSRAEPHHDELLPYPCLLPSMLTLPSRQDPEMDFVEGCWISVLPFPVWPHCVKSPFSAFHH